jgi:hypothetical protein
MTQQKKSANKQTQSVNVMAGKEGLPHLLKLKFYVEPGPIPLNEVQIQATIDCTITHLLLFTNFFPKFDFQITIFHAESACSVSTKNSMRTEMNSSRRFFYRTSQTGAGAAVT